MSIFHRLLEEAASNITSKATALTFDNNATSGNSSTSTITNSSGGDGAYGNPGSTPTPSSNQKDGSDAYEFVAFLLWYVASHGRLGASGVFF